MTIGIWFTFLYSDNTGDWIYLRLSSEEEPKAYDYSTNSWTSWNDLILEDQATTPQNNANVEEEAISDIFHSNSMTEDEKIDAIAEIILLGLWSMKFYIFFIILGLSIHLNILNASSLTNQQRLESLDREIQEFQASIRALQDRYRNLGTNLDKPRLTSVQPDPSIETGSNDFQNQIILEKDNESSSDGEAVTNEEIIYSRQNKNSFRFSYAICIPHDTDFANYKMQYHTGHSIGLTYSRHQDWFFWGLQLGAKFFECF